MRKWFLLGFWLFGVGLFIDNLSGQEIPPITIVRDSFGVPHIYGKTDADVAYGLAWAHAEDDFKNIQYNLLAGKNRLGRVLGKEGVLFDYGLQFLNIRETVSQKMGTDLSPEFLKVIEGYVQGINDYARAHPKEVLDKKAFPATVEDALSGAVLQTSLMAGVGMALKSIRDGRIREFYQINDVGSNALAIAPDKTETGETWLVVNSHQPIEGRFAWYEVHLESEEGWRAIGGLFPGGATIFVGANPWLGWAHTTNYHNFGDVYKIQTHAKNKKKYLFDGDWKDFGERKVKLKVKMAGVSIPVSRKVLLTEFGPVFKNKEGLYAIRFPAYEDIRATEQWYRMNKAQNFNQFEEAVKMQAIPLFNIVYGDNQGNIFLHSGGIVPKRDTALNWQNPIEGISSQHKWTQIVPYEEMPTVLNPECGFVYNCNQTPLDGAGPECEWKGSFIGLHRFTYNRGERFKYFLENHQGKFSWEDVLKIKFDKSYHPDTSGTYRNRFDRLFNLEESRYPDIADAIQKFKKWNLTGEVENTDAALAMVTHDYLLRKWDVPFAFFMINREKLPEEYLVEAVRHARKFLLKTHGSLDVPLGQVQRHIRGSVSIPASGLREVSRAADSRLVDAKKGIYRINSGDGYIQMVRFSANKLPEIFSINAYGSSARPESPHYTDQMEMFQKEQFRTMTFDREKVFSTAERIYHLHRLQP